MCVTVNTCAMLRQVIQFVAVCTVCDIECIHLVLRLAFPRSDQNACKAHMHGYFCCCVSLLCFFFFGWLLQFRNAILPQFLFSIFIHCYFGFFFFIRFTSCKSWFFFHINDKDHPLHVHCLALDEYDWEVSAIQPNRMKLKHLTLGVISISYSTPNNDVNENFAPTWSWIADDVLLLNHCFSIQMR